MARLVKDLVCGSEVDADLVDAGVGTVFGGAPETEPVHGTKRFHDGKWYYFCSVECRNRFMSRPETYIGSSSAG